MLNILYASIVCASPCLGAPTPIIFSSRQGPAMTAGSLCSFRQEEGTFTSTSGTLVSSQWCSHDLSVCVDDNWTGCGQDECTHTWLVYSPWHGSTIAGTPGIPISFWATEPSGRIQTGTWSGRCDWNLDGTSDFSDVAACVAAVQSGFGDYNLSGSVDSSDMFDFLTDFFAD